MLLVASNQFYMKKPCMEQLGYHWYLYRCDVHFTWIAKSFAFCLEPNPLTFRPICSIFDSPCARTCEVREYTKGAFSRAPRSRFSLRIVPQPKSRTHRFWWRIDKNHFSIYASQELKRMLLTALYSNPTKITLESILTSSPSCSPLESSREPLHQRIKEHSQTIQEWSSAKLALMQALICLNNVLSYTIKDIHSTDYLM